MPTLRTAPTWLARFATAGDSSAGWSIFSSQIGNRLAPISSRADLAGRFATGSPPVRQGRGRLVDAPLARRARAHMREVDREGRGGSFARHRSRSSAPGRGRRRSHRPGHAGVYGPTTPRSSMLDAHRELALLRREPRGASTCAGMTRPGLRDRARARVPVPQRPLTADGMIPHTGRQRRGRVSEPLAQTRTGSA